MDRIMLRRLCALVLVVAFGLGVALHGVLAANMAPQMTATAMSDDNQSGGCGACGDDGMASSDCTQMCVGFVAVVPADASAATLMPATIPLERVAAVTGRTGPPEPYPPRTFAMV